MGGCCCGPRTELVVMGTGRPPIPQVTAKSPDAEFRRLLDTGRSFQVNDVEFPGFNTALTSMPLGEKIKSKLSEQLRVDGKWVSSLASPSSHSDVGNKIDVYEDKDFSHPFVSTVVIAFADHRPLTLKPVHFWMLISRAVGFHVNNATERRAQFLVNADQEEKIVLKARRDDFKNDADNDWAGVVTEFNDRITEHVLEAVLPTLSPDFSNKTPVEDIALKVSFMDGDRHDFWYQPDTRCGFPKITLLGTLDDWKLLRSSAHHLISTKCTTELAEKWLPALDSVLAKLEETAMILHSAEPQDNKIDRTFWSSFCKRGGRFGSGESTWINGWLTVFFPALNMNALEPYSDKVWYAQHVDEGEFTMFFNDFVKGWDKHDFDNGVTTVPVVLKIGGVDTPLLFKSGFVGSRIIRGEDAKTGVDGVMPEVGWWFENAPKTRD